MTSNFLEVDEASFNKKFLLSGLGIGEGDDGAEDNEGDSVPGLSWARGGNRSGICDIVPIVTPSQRKEASQCKFIIPKPGACVKTKDTINGKKFFINFCQSDDVPEPQINYTDEELQNILSTGSDVEIDDLRIPISIGEKNVDADSAGVACLTVDVIMNTAFFNNKFLVSEIYQTFFIIVAIEGIEAKHKVTLDRDQYKILKHKKCMGKLSPQFVRSKAGIHEISSRGDGTGSANAAALPFPKKSSQDSTGILLNSDNVNSGSGAKASFLEPVTTKRFVQEVITTKDSHLNCVVTQHSEELATAAIKIPNLINPKKLTVTIGADRLIVECPVGLLDIFLPLDFHQEKCRAEYDPATGFLSLHLPLVVKL